MKKMNLAAALMVSLILSGGSTFAQSAGDEAKKAGDATKEAGKDAKHAGKATGKATKKTAKKVKKAVTGDAHATCVDGTRQEGATEAAAAAACKGHGGVAKR